MHFFLDIVRCVLYPLMFLFEEMFSRRISTLNSDLQATPDDDVEDYVVLTQCQPHYLNQIDNEQQL